LECSKVPKFSNILRRGRNGSIGNRTLCTSITGSAKPTTRYLKMQNDAIDLSTRYFISGYHFYRLKKIKKHLAKKREIAKVQRRAAFYFRVPREDEQDDGCHHDGPL